MQDSQESKPVFVIADSHPFLHVELLQREVERSGAVVIEIDDRIAPEEAREFLRSRPNLNSEFLIGLLDQYDAFARLYEAGDDRHVEYELQHGEWKALHEALAPLKQQKVEQVMAGIEAQEVDAFIFPGNDHVTVPLQYWKQEVPPGKDGQPLDAFDIINPYDIQADIEMAMAKKAIAEHIPSIGVCRGAQLLNIAMGGRLIDIRTDQGIDSERHMDGRYGDLVVAGKMDFGYSKQDVLDAMAGAPDVEGQLEQARAIIESRLQEHTHGFEVVPGSPLAQMIEMNGGSIEEGWTALSIHYQGIKPEMLGDGLEPMAISPDGVVEAYVGTDGLPIMAFQYHPEGHEVNATAMIAPFVAFVADRKQALAQEQEPLSLQDWAAREAEQARENGLDAPEAQEREASLTHAQRVGAEQRVSEHSVLIH